jgi:succinoglycan biosynthesis transport protein ExoP
MDAQLQERRGEGRVVDDGIAGVLRRRRGWILGFAFAGLVLSVVGAYLWPDTYQSTAALALIDPLDAGGASDASSLNLRVRKIASTVETPLALESMIGMYGLYPNERKHLGIEDVVENFKHKIHVSEANRLKDGARTRDVFRISFDYFDRVKAQKVVQDLAGRFMSLSGSNVTSDKVAPGFSKDQAETAGKDLEAAEAKLEEFRTANEGLMPEQAEANQRKLTELETRRTKVRTGIASLQAEQITLEAGIVSDREKRLNVKEYVDVPAPPRPPNKQLIEYDKQIQALDQRIKTLKEQYTEKYPDVIDARQRLAAIRTQRDALAKEEAANAPGPTRKADPEAQRTSAELDQNIRNAQNQIAAKTTEIAELNKELAEVDEDIQAMKTRLKEMPSNEKQYAELLRDRDLKKAQVDEAEIKSRAAVEGQQVKQPGMGEALELVEPASLPVAPLSPNRGTIIGAGSFMGLLIGLILGGIRELKSPDAALAAPAVTIQRGLPEWSIWALVIVSGVAAMTLSIGYYVIYRQ